MRVVLYDLEVSRAVVEGYGNRYDFKVVRFNRPQQLMCYAWKELGNKKTNFVYRQQFNTYKEFVESLRNLLDEADITVAHNGGSFDDKMANRFFVLEGLTPPRPRKTVDTWREARRWFKFESNSLDDLGMFFGFGGKEQIGYTELEDDMMAKRPSKKAIRLMRQYNVRDVELLEKIYLKLRPFMMSHPNLGDLKQIDGVCPKCGSHHLKLEGTHARRHGRVQSYSCKDCGGWCNESSIKKKGRLVNGL